MNKIACKFKANDYALWINGVEKDTNTTQSNTVQSGTLNSLNLILMEVITSTVKSKQ